MHDICMSSSGTSFATEDTVTRIKHHWATVFVVASIAKTPAVEKAIFTVDPIVNQKTFTLSADAGTSELWPPNCCHGVETRVSASSK